MSAVSCLAGPAIPSSRRRRQIMRLPAAAPAPGCWPIVVSKYDDHLPLFRKAEIFAARAWASTLSGWVGATAAALQPLMDALTGEVMASDTLHVDDRPVPVLAPGTSKTKTLPLTLLAQSSKILNFN